MKTLQITKKQHELSPVGDVVLHEGKSAREVLRERYEDTCVLEEKKQPRSLSNSASYPTTYIIRDRADCERKEKGQMRGVLVELP